MNSVVDADSIRGRMLTPTQAKAIKRHADFVRGIAEKAALLASPLPPTVPHAPEPDPPAAPTVAISIHGRMATIQRHVCKSFKLELPEMLSSRRDRHIVAARQVAMHLCKKLTSQSLVLIGRKFGDRDHTTTLHACRRIEKILSMPAGSGLSIQCPAHFCDMMREKTASLLDELILQFPDVRSDA